MRVARRVRVAPTALESVPLPAWQFDTSGHALQVNAAFLAWCGRTETEMLGLGWQTLVHSEDLVALRAAWAAAD
ncbi:MAG: PAS domain-containing protein, partial [Gammaproteobacteria bacterium]|nr:PAS domain-containing protein [Gammaproteobacteria bacterium]